MTEKTQQLEAKLAGMTQQYLLAEDEKQRLQNHIKQQELKHQELIEKIDQLEKQILKNKYDYNEQMERL